MKALGSSSDISYPDAPGFKAHGPSEEAAIAVAATTKPLRARVLATISASPAGFTANGLAAELGSPSSAFIRALPNSTVRARSSRPLPAARMRPA